MIDLDRPRDLAEILGACFSLYRANFTVFATIALAIVIPLDLLTLGVIDGYLWSGFDETEAIATGGGAAYSIVQTLITTPLITGSHVAAVMALGRGEKRPTVGGSLSAAGNALPALIGAILLTAIGTILGLIALIVPGIYLIVRWFVVSQSVVAESRGPTDAIARSWELTEGAWWRVFGVLLALLAIALILGGIVGAATGTVAMALDSGPLFVLASIVVDSIILSFVALSGTILFFDLRARKEGSADGVPPSASDGGSWNRPEAPPGA